MKELLKRLGTTLLEIASLILAMIIVVTVLATFIIFIIMLPMWLLQFVIGDLSGWWVFISIIGFIVIAEWEFISSKFKWIFIEPFSKNSKIK